MELDYDGMIGRLNLLTTATPTVYDFIAGSYTLLGMSRKNSGKRLPRWTIVSEQMAYWFP